MKINESVRAVGLKLVGILKIIDKGFAARTMAVKYVTRIKFGERDMEPLGCLDMGKKLVHKQELFLIMSVSMSITHPNRKIWYPWRLLTHFLRLRGLVYIIT
jgi:hypothetical protein